MSLKRNVLWLCVLAGCSLQVAPKSSSGAQRTNVDADEWMPEQRPDAGERRNTSKNRDAGSEPQVDAAAAVASSTHAEPAADGGKPQAQAGQAANDTKAQGGAPAAATAANGGEGGAAPSQDNGGTGGSEPRPDEPATEPSAGAQAPAPTTAGTTPAAGGGGAGGRGGAGGQGGASGPRNVREALVDAVISVMSRGNGNGNGNQNDWNNWRRAAGESGELAPEFVTPILNALLLSGTCFEKIETCISVCVVVAQNCGPCVADKDCKAALSRVCGERAASCPGAMMMPKP